MSGFGLAAPARLAVLLLVAALVGWYVYLQNQRPEVEVRLAQTQLLASVMPRRAGKRRYVTAALMLVAMSVLSVGFARPYAKVTVPTSEATIMVALDVSGSMQATDVSPNRLEAAKAGAKAFVRQLPARFAIGLVAFNNDATVLNSPSEDKEAVLASIDSLQFGGGTAIGDAVHESLLSAKAYNQVHGTGSSKDGTLSNLRATRVVLLSDGSNNSGRSIDEAIVEARAADVPISTIAYGTPDGSVNFQGQNVTVPADTQALKGLAEQTHGTAYTAQSAGQLQHVYDDITRRLGTTKARRDISASVDGAGLLMLFIGCALSMWWFRVVP